MESRLSHASSVGNTPPPLTTRGGGAAFAIVGYATAILRKSGVGGYVISMDHDEMKDAFLRAYDAHGDEIFRFCVMKVTNRELAQDLTQEVFMRFWQQQQRGAVLKNERAFLYTLARNLIIDWYRKKKESSLDAIREQGVDFSGDDHRRIEQDAQMNEVLAVVGQLDEQARDAILLRYVEGFTPKEIAEITGETANAVSVRINRAIKKVQAILDVT